jgi:hypothetical protein
MQQQNYEILHNGYIYEFKYPWNYPTNTCEILTKIALNKINEGKDAGVKYRIKELAKHVKKTYFTKFWESKK